MKLIRVIFICFFSLHSFAQNNLVKNASFEDNNIICDGFDFWFLNNWSTPSLNTPDNFSPFCNDVSLQVPVNGQGFQFPRTGNSYVGILTGVVTYVFTESEIFGETKEYIQGELFENLEVGKRYCVGGYTSLANLSQSQIEMVLNLGGTCCATLAINKLGVSFSNTKDFYNTTGTINKDNVIDLRWKNNEFLSDTLNWMQIENNFIAKGDEKYMIFGNYNNIIDCDFTIEATFNVDSFNIAVYEQINRYPAQYVYYYFDDMYVYEIPPTKIVSQKRSPLEGGGYVLYAAEGSGNAAWYALPDTVNAIATTDSLFVNPLSTTTYLLKRSQCRYTDTDTLTLTITQPTKPSGIFVVNNLSQASFQVLYYDRAPLQLYLYNSAGQLVKTQTFAESAEINISDLAAGVYYCRIMNGNSFVLTEKVVKMQ